MTVVEICAFACDRVRPSHAFFAPSMKPAIPNFCTQLFVVTLRLHVMNLVVETDNLVDGQRQRPRSLQKEAFDSFDNMLCPHLESCALPEKKTRKRRNDPVSFITVNCADVCVVRITLGFSVTASASCELEVESFVASSFSATKLSLDW